MGTIYLAQDDSLLRTVAIKILAGKPGEESQAQYDRLIQEARAQARVSHPNVVHIYYVGRHGDRPFFAMEHVQGQPLSQRISERRLSFPEISRIAIETVEALRHSARLGVIHGDVKPGNILLTESGTVKLTDFGLSRESGPESSSAGPSGTLDYMAPEVAGGQTADSLSDQFSLGVMLYQMTFGDLPLSLSAFGLREGLRIREQANVHLPAEWPPDRPTVWGPVLAKMLQRDRSLRFCSYDELYAELGRLQPVPLHPAGLVGRFLSWFLDQLIFIVTLGIGFAIGLSTKTAWSFGPRGVDLVVEAYLVTIGAGLIWFSHKYHSSPGKKLLQLNLVDQFGLPPTAWRGVLSVGGTWVILIAIALETLGRATLQLFRTPVQGTQILLGQLLFGIAGVWIVLNGIWLIFSSRKQTLADQLLSLFVVLDSRVNPIRKPFSTGNNGTATKTGEMAE